MCDGFVHLIKISKNEKNCFFLISFLSFQFPLPSQYQKSSDNNLGLNYVTERILGSVLPRRDISDIHQHRPHSEGPVDIQLQDKYEKELILMLEQKHGKVRKIGWKKRKIY